MAAFDDFVKTDTAARLRGAAARRALSHALIFSGPGDRDSAARYASAAFECTADGARPCLRCVNCRKVLAGIHPDVKYVRDTAHKELSVDVIRAMRADAAILPNEGARKVYIFEDCAILNEKDQNILLKTVEEGPPYAAFVFCAENPSVLLPTIRSRCVELKTLPAGAAEPEEEELSAAAELCRTVAEGDAAERAAYLNGLDRKGSKLTRETLGTLLEQSRGLFAAALLSLYGVEPRGAARSLAPLLTRRLTKEQIVRTIELLGKYRKDCTYNVGVGPVLGALAAEWEELL